MIDWKAKRAKCPACGEDGEGGAYGTLGIGKFSEGPRQDELVAHCFRCQKVFWPDRQHCTTDDKQSIRHERRKFDSLSDYGQQLWAACRPLAGDALAYLRERNAVIPSADGDLRYHPALKHTPSGTVGPALVALVTDAITRQPLTLHRTWIRADGRKAAVEPPRMLLAGHRKAGGVVRLWPDDAVAVGLGIAEGIETTLSLAHAYTPVWACIDAGNLGAFPVLNGIGSLMIAADNDRAGIAAAEACAARWALAGRQAYIAMPEAAKADMNDLARDAA